MSNIQEQDASNFSQNSLLEAQKEHQYKYWQEVYGHGYRSFDWIGDWALHIRPLLAEYLHPAKKVLHLGCGNSKMSEELLDDNFDEIINLDFSDELIKSMKEHYKDYPKLKWVVGDCAALSFDGEQFDYVFDKGALDAMNCGERYKDSVPSTFKEVARVLKKDGYFILVSLGMFESNFNELAPSNLKLRKRYEFTLPENTQTNFVYVYQKE